MGSSVCYYSNLVYLFDAVDVEEAAHQVILCADCYKMPTVPVTVIAIFTSDFDHSDLRSKSQKCDVIKIAIDICR